LTRKSSPLAPASCNPSTPTTLKDSQFTDNIPHLTSNHRVRGGCWGSPTSFLLCPGGRRCVPCPSLGGEQTLHDTAAVTLQSLCASAHLPMQHTEAGLALQRHLV
jgi:hypothetical protein